VSADTTQITLAEAWDKAIALNPGEALDKRYVMVLTGELDRLMLILGSLHRHVHPQPEKGARGETYVDRQRVGRLTNARTTSAFNALIEMARLNSQPSLERELVAQKAYWVATAPR
jgi:hypothetical protein